MKDWITSAAQTKPKGVLVNAFVPLLVDAAGKVRPPSLVLLLSSLECFVIYSFYQSSVPLVGP